MARGDAPSVTRAKLQPPEGIPAPDKVLMVHPGCGYRWILKAEQPKKEKWGYAFVRDYSPNDELGNIVELGGLSKDELREKSRMLMEMADGPEKVKAPTTEAEKKYLAKLAKEKQAEKAREDRAKGKGAK